MLTGSATILRADARSLPLADASVDLVVTSPPYFALRSYTDGGEHYDGQIGAEPTPQEYIASLIDCTREWMRVLKPGGSCWVNLGDKYSTGNSGQSGMAALGERWAGGGHTDGKAKQRSGRVPGMQPKSLIGLPWRYALACIDDLDLILRAEVIWDKPNGLPESVSDRVRRSHEQWFHFVRLPRYFSAVDEIREAHSERFAANHKPGSQNGSKPAAAGMNHQLTGARRPPDPLGKLPGSVWEIATEPLTVPEHLGVSHFAAFPTEWPRRIILGWSPSGICTACGEGRRPAIATDDDTRKPYRTEGIGTRPQGGARFAKVLREDGAGGDLRSKRRTITGEACACPEPTSPTRPAVVLDPFMGTGTVLLVAKALGRIGVGTDLSADYCRLAAWRTNDPGEIAKAMRVEKPAKQVDGQQDLLAALGEAS